MKRVSLLFAWAVLGCGSSVTEPTDAGQLPTGPLQLVPFEAPSTAAVNNSLLITLSGETAATQGASFPPASSGDPYYLDGWALHFEQVIVTVARVTLSENPDLNPNDQSQTDRPVAVAMGPWAVDLAKAGPLASKEMNGQSVPVVRLRAQNLVAGAPPFEPTLKYAFGFDLIVPAGPVQNVNLDERAQAALATMAQQGWAVFMQGTASWHGEGADPSCRQTAPYDFGRFAREVTFSLGFAVPTTYKNCLNPELSPEGSRGLQTQANAQLISQITFHLDHPFWEALQEDAPLRLDALAARSSVPSGMGPASASVTQDDLVGLDFQDLRDAQGTRVPFRTCGPLLTPERSTGTLFYDPGNVPVNPAGGAAGLKDLLAYMAYNLSSFGHLNNDGLCFPSRNFAAPH